MGGEGDPRILGTSGSSTREVIPQIGGPPPPPQLMMTQYLGDHLPILGAAASGTRGGIPQPTPMASTLNVGACKSCDRHTVLY